MLFELCQHQQLTRHSQSHPRYDGGEAPAPLAARQFHGRGGGGRAAEREEEEEAAEEKADRAVTACGLAR